MNYYKSLNGISKDYDISEYDLNLIVIEIRRVPWEPSAVITYVIGRYLTDYCHFELLPDWRDFSHDNILTIIASSILACNI